MDLRARALEFTEKLSKIKVCAFDVDGILTDGKVWWDGAEVGWNRATHTRDGYGLKVLQRNGFKVGVITGGDSYSVTKRFEENLGLDFVYKGHEDKMYAFEDLLNQGYEDDEILYMGDEHFDMPLLQRAGFSATVPEASCEVRDVVDYITSREGGTGAVREVIDLLRLARGIPPELSKKNLGQ